MKNLLRLLRYGLPYSLKWLPGVLLLAVTGILDTFRVLLLQPIFDKVLRPDAPEGPIVLGLTTTPYHFDLRMLVPHFIHMHNAWDVVAAAMVLPTVLKGLCDYTGTYLVNYAGFGTDYRPAQPSVRGDDAPLVELLSQASDGNDSFHAD